MNNFSAIVHLGADPEVLTLGGREVAKLRCAEKAYGKKAKTRWFNLLVGGPDVEVSGRLRKGDQLFVSGQLVLTEFKPKKARFKGEMVNSDEMPFGKILQVLKSETFFSEGQDEGDENDSEADTGAAPGDDGSDPGSAVMDDL